MPVSIPEIPNSSGEISISRVSSTASACSSSSRPLASPSPGASSGTTSGASRKPIAAATKVARAIRFSTLEASHQPSSSLSRSTTRLKVGMKAAERVAPASSWKIASGSRKATQ